MSAIQRYAYKLGTVPGGQNICNLNYLQVPFNTSILVDIVSGSAEFSIEFTHDDVGGDPTTFRWVLVPGLAAGQTATTTYSLANFPVTAVRLNIASITGEVRLSVIQGTGTL
jgi:hypothetical protein